MGAVEKNGVQFCLATLDIKLHDKSHKCEWTHTFSQNNPVIVSLMNLCKVVNIWLFSVQFRCIDNTNHKLCICYAYWYFIYFDP